MHSLIKDDLREHIIAALAPCRYEGLISRRAVADICRSECGSFPAAMTSLLGFECRLDQEEPLADFLVRVGAEPHEWAALADYAAAREHPIWRRTRELLTERAQPGSPLPALLHNLWLEYDFRDSADTLAGPSVFFGTDRLTRNAETQWAAEVAGELRGKPLSLGMQATLNGLVSVLPGSAKLFQVGMMCSRSDAPLRVCINGQEFAEAAIFLADAEWPGDSLQLSEILERLAPFVDSAALDLDIFDDGRLAPKLGVEFYLRPSQDLGPRTVAFVNNLSRSNLCLPSKATGLLLWSGITHERLYPDLWPATWTRQRALRSGESSTFCRWLHHVKVVLEPGARPIAKAYLAVSHAFLADSLIREALQQATSSGSK